MKPRKKVRKFSFFIYAAMFTLNLYFSLSEKKSYETILYCAALVGSLFLGVLELCGWGAKKPEQKEKREGAIL